MKWKILRQMGVQDIWIQLPQSKMIWDIMHLLKLVGRKSCQILILWNKIKNILKLNINREKFPRRRFDIEGEAFKISHDEEDPKVVQEVISSPTSKEWIKMNSMKSNQV